MPGEDPLLVVPVSHHMVGGDECKSRLSAEQTRNSHVQGHETRRKEMESLGRNRASRTNFCSPLLINRAI
jgi:hypothetical protein